MKSLTFNTGSYHEYVMYHIEIVAVWSWGLLNNPERITNISYDHHSKLLQENHKKKKNWGKFWLALAYQKNNTDVYVYLKYHIIAADGMANRKNPLKSWSAFQDRGALVFANLLENLT